MLTDMTKGNLKTQIVLFALPLCISNLFQQLYGFVDTLVVGRFLGVQALASVGSTTSLSFLVIGFVQGMTAGFSIITSQRFGKANSDGSPQDETRRSLLTTVVLCMILTVILTAISVLCSSWMLRVMNTPYQIFSQADSYITIIFYGLFASVYYNMMASQLRALGDSRTPLFFLIICSVLNAVLDIVAVAWLKTGVEGAAMATVISQLTSALLCTFYSRRRFKLLAYRLKELRTTLTESLVHLRSGLPMALQCSVTALGVMILQSSLNSFGPLAIAGFTAASRLGGFMEAGFISIGVSMATFCGQNMGSGKVKRIRQGIGVATLYTVILCAVSMVIVLLLGRDFISLLVDRTQVEVFDYAMIYLTYVTVFFPFLGILILYRNALQGIGYSFIPFLGGVLELVSRYVVCSILPARIGYRGVALATPLAWVLTTIVLLATYFCWCRRIKEA